MIKNRNNYRCDKLRIKGYMYILGFGTASYIYNIRNSSQVLRYILNTKTKMKDEKRR